MRLLFFLLLLPIGLFSQDTFIKVFDLDAPGGSFYNSAIINDTVVISGIVKAEDSSHQGLFLMKTDTLGNVHLISSFFAPDNDNYTLIEGRKMLLCSDEEILIISHVLSEAKPLFLKLSKEGDEISSIKKYSTQPNTNIRLFNAVEVDDGFILTGTKSTIADGYKSDALIIKTDFQGNKLWEASCGEFDVYDRFVSIHEKENNELLLIGYTTTGFATSNPQLPMPDEATNRHKFLRINSGGEIIEEWEDEEYFILESENSIVRNQMQIDETGNFIQGGRVLNLEYIPPDPEPFAFYQCQIIKRDSDFNIVWNTPVGNHRGLSEFYEVIPHDDGWLAVGRNWVDNENENRGYAVGFIAKVDDYGNELWTRTDTAFYAANPDDGTIRHLLNSVVTLPSGSIIATGRIENYDENPARSYGWMIKLDKDGCLTPACHPNLVSVDYGDLLSRFEVYPNPSQDYVRVEGKGKFKVEVYDSTGRQVIGLRDYTDSGTLDISALSTGLYFVNIHTEGRVIVSKSMFKF